MNERIEQLAKQVGAVRNVMAMGRHDGVLFTEFELEKFAELIVRECAEISEQSQWSEAKGEYYEGFNEAMIYVSNKIKEHFGVE